jgi:hypothetical protein
LCAVRVTKVAISILVVLSKGLTSISHRPIVYLGESEARK